MPVRSPALESLGGAIRSFREAKGLSQEALGFESGLDRTYVGGLERGERNPSIESLLKLCGALDVTLASVVAKAGL